MQTASLTEGQAEFRNFLRTGKIETRQLGYGADDAGGVLAPKSFADKVWMRLKESFVRQHATVVQCSQSFQASFVSTEPTVGVRTPAATTGVITLGTDSSPALSLPTFNATARELKPRFLTVTTYVSRELLEDAQTGASVEDLLATVFARKIMEEENKQAIVGTGNNQYLGIRQACIDASQTVATASATSLALTDFQEAIEKVGIGVYQNACWILSPYAFRALSAYTTTASGTIGIGSSALQTHIVDGKPVLTLYGRPVHLTDHLTLSTTTGGFQQPASNDYSVLLADLSQYLIAEASGFRVDRYDEWDNGTLGAKKNQVTFIGRIRSDGALLDPKNAVAIKH